MKKRRGPDPVAVGRRLREARGVFRTQQEVAEATGIPRATLCSYEIGRALPKAPTMAVLADYYETTVEKLFFA